MGKRAPPASSTPSVTAKSTTSRNAWKARQIASNLHASLTATTTKRIPFVPWTQIPAAMITFAGEASVHGVEEVAPEIPRSLLRGLELGPEDQREITSLNSHAGPCR